MLSVGFNLFLQSFQLPFICEVTNFHIRYRHLFSRNINLSTYRVHVLVWNFFCEVWITAGNDDCGFRWCTWSGGFQAVDTRCILGLWLVTLGANATRLLACCTYYYTLATCLTTRLCCKFGSLVVRITSHMKLVSQQGCVVSCSLVVHITTHMKLVTQQLSRLCCKLLSCCDVLLHTWNLSHNKVAL